LFQPYFNWVSWTCFAERYSTSDANLIPVTLCVRRILARPALLAAAPPSFERAGDEFRAVRFKLGLSSLEWGLALGYAGKPDNIRTQIRTPQA
jgi:hypothetical protein